MHLTLLSRAYCHLCDEMLAAARPLAAARGMTVIVVDIDADPVLDSKYGDRVPVLFVGKPDAQAEVCHYRFDRGLFDEALAKSGAPRD